MKRREGLGCNLGCSKRWDDGLRQRRLSSAGHEQNEGQNDAGKGAPCSDPLAPISRALTRHIRIRPAASRWQRGQVFASKISEGGGAGSSDRPADPSAEDEKERLGRVNLFARSAFGPETAEILTRFNLSRTRRRRPRSRRSGSRRSRWKRSIGSRWCVSPPACPLVTRG